MGLESWNSDCHIRFFLNTGNSMYVSSQSQKYITIISFHEYAGNKGKSFLFSASHPLRSYILTVVRSGTKSWNV
jgi:hypothetical protein